MQVPVGRKWVLEIAIRPHSDRVGRINRVDGFRRNRFVAPKHIDASRQWDLDKLAGRALGNSYAPYGYGNEVTHGGD